MKAYFARSISQYRSQQDHRDIETITKLFTTDISDPDVFFTKEEYNEKGMNMFKERIRQCDVLVFRAHPNGDIPAGVGKEIKFAQKIGIPVIELPNAINSRTLSVEETREYLKNIGHR